MGHNLVGIKICLTRPGSVSEKPCPYPLFLTHSKLKSVRIRPKSNLRRVNIRLAVRANQRDLYHVSSLREQTESVLRSWLGMFYVYGYQESTNLGDRNKVAD